MGAFPPRVILFGNRPKSLRVNKKQQILIGFRPTFDMNPCQYSITHHIILLHLNIMMQNKTTNFLNIVRTQYSIVKLTIQQN